MDLPLPDNDAGPDARDRLETIDLPGAGLGALSEAIEFAAATQGTTIPRPWRSARVLLLSGSHAGGAAAGTDPADVERQVAQVEAGEGALSRLAGEAGADVAVLRLPASGAMEDGPVLDADAVETALQQGWQLADQAADDGKDVLVLGSCGVGTDATAAAVMAATTGAEPAAVLPRVLAPGGRYDDAAWMVRCAAVRDAMHRIRQEPRGAKDILAQIGGADLAVATGALLGAAARRLPVLLDGPVGIAAGLIARDLGAQTRHWCLLPDAGTSTLVKQGADVLGLTPVTDLRLDLGEGANALAMLPLLRSAIGLASALPVHPFLLAGHGDAGLSTTTDADELGGDLIVPNDDADEDFAEPEPDGPGPASTEPVDAEPEGTGPTGTGPASTGPASSTGG
jgi:NaMN:DMB phosphoribosyltransferase